MATCKNCNAKLSCGCQKRKASDGKEVCTNCVNTYESSLKVNKHLVTIHEPTNVQSVKVFYNGPGVQTK
jgi:positive regulator of sigma E activity